MINVFTRVEKKFWMNQTQYDQITELISQKMEIDQYGLSTIYSLYYDTDDFYLIRRSIERPFYKEKLRLRSYQNLNSGSTVYIEMKKKLDGVGYKRRARMDFDSAMRLLKGERAANGIVENEIVQFQHRYHTSPKVLLTYQREAFQEKEGKDLRVTFDQNLCFQLVDEKGISDSFQPIQGTQGRYLMEIKSEKGIPLWLTEELSKLQIYQSPYSKIGDCYLKHCNK